MSKYRVTGIRRDHAEPLCLIEAVEFAGRIHSVGETMNWLDASPDNQLWVLDTLRRWAFLGGATVANTTSNIHYSSPLQPVRLAACRPSSSGVAPAEHEQRAGPSQGNAHGG